MSSPKMPKEMKKENFGKDSTDMIEADSETGLSDVEMSEKSFTQINLKNITNYETESFIENSLNLDDYPKKLGYNQVHDILVDTFFTKENYLSSVFDIISSYIKAQKILYLESRAYCVFYLNCLMLPAIFLSSLASVLSLAIENYAYGGVILAGVNAFNSFILAVINYSKLDAASEAHKTTAHQYDKLQSMCEFTSGKLLLFPDIFEKIEGDNKKGDNKKSDNKKGEKDGDEYLELVVNNGNNKDNQKSNKENQKSLIEKLDYIETKVTEIKETNTFIIPSEIIKRLPTIYHTNIFSKIKDYVKKEIITTNKIKDRLNELRPIEYRVRVLKENDRHTINRINNLRRCITKLTEELIKNSNENTQIEKSFKKEIQRLNNLSRCYRVFC